jgi:L-fucose isomerase, first N-terminal domain
MRTTPIGFVMLNDERPHVHAVNESENMAVLGRWATALVERVRNVDGSAPELVLGRETIKSVRTAQAVGEELRQDAPAAELVGRSRHAEEMGFGRCGSPTSSSTRTGRRLCARGPRGARHHRHAAAHPCAVSGVLVAQRKMWP